METNEFAEDYCVLGANTWQQFMDSDGKNLSAPTPSGQSPLASTYLVFPLPVAETWGLAIVLHPANLLKAPAENSSSWTTICVFSAGPEVANEVAIPGVRTFIRLMLRLMQPAAECKSLLKTIRSVTMEVSSGPPVPSFSLLILRYGYSLCSRRRIASIAACTQPASLSALRQVLESRAGS